MKEKILKYKYLVANGCSFTKGSCMIDDKDKQLLTSPQFKKNRFSKKLSDKLNIEEINIANSGKSNDRIFRELFYWVAENEDKVKDSLFLVGLSESTRKDLYSNYLKKYIISYEIYQDLKLIARDFNAPLQDVEKWRNFELKYMIDEDEVEKKIIRDCVLFDSLVGGNVIFLNAWRKSDVVHPKLKFVHFDEEGYKGYNWVDFIRAYDKDWSLGHPWKSHHHRLTDIIYRFITKGFK